MASFIATKMSKMTTIGKPLSGEEGSDSQNAEINWNDFNYPPCIRIIHYDLDDVSADMRKKVKHMNMAFKITFFAMLLNVFNSIIIVASSSEAPGSWIFLSVVHWVLLSSISLYVFYQGYQGICLGGSSLRSRYMFGQAVFALVYFLLFLLGSGPVNGVLKLAQIRHYTVQADALAEYWTVMVIIEASMWAVNFFLALASIIYMHTFNESNREMTAVMDSI